MTPDQLTGRALDEAAARAMGWTYNMGVWKDSQGGWQGCLEPEPTEREMLAWLHGRGEVNTSSTRTHAKASTWFDGWPYLGSSGTDLREALERLVVAVKQREDAK